MYLFSTPNLRMQDMTLSSLFIVQGEMFLPILKILWASTLRTSTSLARPVKKGFRCARTAIIPSRIV
jgi:hypothetical protein